MEFKLYISKSYNFLKSNQADIIAWAIFIKMITLGITLVDCLGSLVILITPQAARVIEYYFPKRPDLFKEMEAFQIELNSFKRSMEDAQSDITAIKFGMTKR